MAQTHWGGPGTLLPSMRPGGSRKPGVRLWDRSPHPASPTSPKQFPEPRHSPEAMGMGALGCPGHGCYPARRKGGQSLPAPRKAAPMPARRASPLPCCPQAPLPRSARLGWPLCPAAADTALGGAVRCWAVGGRGTPTARIGRCCAPLLVPLAAPSLSPAKEAPRGRYDRGDAGTARAPVASRCPAATQQRRRRSSLGWALRGTPRQGLWVLGKATGRAPDAAVP